MFGLLYLLTRNALTIIFHRAPDWVKHENMKCRIGSKGVVWFRRQTGQQRGIDEFGDLRGIGAGIGRFNVKLLLDCSQARDVSCVMWDRSEEIRIRYKYRKLILSGKAKISLDAAQALVGPDRAYHLYGVIASSRKRTSSDRLRQPLSRSS